MWKGVVKLSENNNWFMAILDAEIEKKWDNAVQRVAKIRELHPNMDPDSLVNLEIDDKSLWAGFIGIGTGGLESIPVVGQAIALGSILPEAVYLARMQVDIALIVAFLYQKDITKEEVKPIIITCLVLAMGSDFIKKQVTDVAIHITKEAILKLITRMGEQQIISIMAKVGIKASTHGILAKVPVLAIPLNSAFNYSQIQSFGWIAKKFMSPTFVMCGNCGFQTGKLNSFCSQCGVGLH